ncbi:MAG: GldG family protein, partial [Acidobacteria bacterium]|nr:GldG family protein [Acidobacteriota bacterium]
MLNRILGLLGWLGVALVFSAVAVRFLKPEMQRLYSGLALAGLACTLLYMLSQWREVGRAFSGRSARFGALAAGSVAVVLAILVGINYIASRQNKRWDLTASRVYSLSDQTKKILDGLKSPVKIRVFARSEEFDRFRDRLGEYDYASDNVSVEYIDVFKSPALANQYQVQQVGTVVFEHEGRIERATSDGEQELTNALIKAVQG